MPNTVASIGIFSDHIPLNSQLETTNNPWYPVEFCFHIVIRTFLNRQNTVKHMVADSEEKFHCPIVALKIVLNLDKFVFTEVLKIIWNNATT